MSVRTLQGGALVVWPETLSRTPWLINKLAGGPPFYHMYDIPYDILYKYYTISYVIENQAGGGIQLKAKLFLSNIIAKDYLFFNSRSKSNVPSAIPIHRITKCIHTMIRLFGITNRVENEEKDKLRSFVPKFSVFTDAYFRF